MTKDISLLLACTIDEIVVDFTVTDVETDLLVRLSGKLTRNEPYVNKQILFSGDISYTLHEQCSRCLKNCDISINFHCNEEFSSKASVDDNSDAYSYYGNEIDFTDMLLTNITFSKPCKVLCQEDCKGLCPICGIDRNISSCECESNKRNSAFDALLESFSKDGGV